MYLFSLVQSLSRLWLCDPMDCSTSGFLSITNSRSLRKFMSIELLMPSNHLILCHWWPLALSLSQHQELFQWVSSSHKEAKVLELQFRISPSKKYSGSTSFRIDCLISLLSNRLSRVFSNTTVPNDQFFSIQLFFMVQLSHPYMTTGKTLTRCFFWLDGPLLAK